MIRHTYILLIAEALSMETKEQKYLCALYQLALQVGVCFL